MNPGSVVQDSRTEHQDTTEEEEAMEMMEMEEEAEEDNQEQQGLEEVRMTEAME